MLELTDCFLFSPSVQAQLAIDDFFFQASSRSFYISQLFLMEKGVCHPYEALPLVFKNKQAVGDGGCQEDPGAARLQLGAPFWCRPQGLAAGQAGREKKGSSLCL